MANRRSISFNIAYCGVICALSVLVMFVSLVPAMTYVMPAVSGLIIWTVASQINKKWGILCYASVSLLTFILVPEFEANIFFIFIWGYYPLAYMVLSEINSIILRYILKFSIFNIAALLGFFVVSRVLGIDKMIDSLSDFGDIAIYILWAAGNVMFFFYDMSLKYVMFAYDKWIMPKLKRKMKS